LAGFVLAESQFASFAFADVPATQAANPPATQPATGIVYREEISDKPLLHLHICTIDLTNPAIHIKVSHGGVDPKISPPWETTLMPVSKMAERDGLVVAVNANFFGGKETIPIMGKNVPYFTGNWARCCGFAMSDGKLFSENPLTIDWPSMVVDAGGKIRFGQFRPVPADARQIVSGSGMLVVNGRDVMPVTPASSPDATPYPRTAVGIDKDEKTLILLVADGKQPDYSVGLSIRDLAEEMVHLGAWQALNLDSGGSSTMVVRNAAGVPVVVNRPSDGHDFPIRLSVERSVADALGVTVDGVKAEN
jgi:exopolysaccharide biosynthesis protein